ncbi:MMP9 [Lepeophtheirus salmonis]|uniref:MMP9 n=1 Tax=Lepeophtheirus salmonis TaxID=72036 RepID=A0A7R8CJD1_LEPSM|nr:MMP9 [Lepeophtheirus salmonis]CAF2835583.1 MMP9 [Lepeophtheirus salmonis]
MFLLIIIPQILSLASSQTCETPTGSCIFPFKHLGKVYTGCIIKDSSLPWCATSVDSELNYIKYDYCPASCEESPIATKPGACKTVDGVYCVFPFVYQGTSYNSCTNADYGSTFWCATAVGTGNVVTSYGTCSTDCQSSSSGSTVCETASGDSCVFPYIYNKVNYVSCTSIDSSFPWCATSVSNGEYNDNYGYCDHNCEVGVTVPLEKTPPKIPNIKEPSQ